MSTHWLAGRHKDFLYSKVWWLIYFQQISSHFPWSRVWLIFEGAFGYVAKKPLAGTEIWNLNIPVTCYVVIVVYEDFKVMLS